MDSESEDHIKRHQRLEDELLGQYGGVRVNLLPGRTSRSGLERTSLEHTDPLEVSAALESQLREYADATRKADEYTDPFASGNPSKYRPSHLRLSDLQGFLEEMRRAYDELQKHYPEPDEQPSHDDEPDPDEP